MKRLEVNQTIIPEKKRLLHHWEKVLESGKLTNNQVEVQSFQNELKVSCHRSHALAVSSGTMALHLLIRALDLPKGEIIVPAFSFVATASAPLWEGYNVVLCDIDPKTLCLDPIKVEARISSNTRAILGVHVFGQPCAVEKLEALGNKHGIPVIYDGAHAMGSMLHNKSLLAYGLASMTSLHTSKIVSSIEGGALFTDDDSLYKRLFQMRYFGRNASNQDELLGTNAKMHEFSAAYGQLSLARLKEEVEARRKIAAQYDEAFLAVSGLDIFKESSNHYWNRAYYPIQVHDSAAIEQIMEQGENQNIGFRPYWRPALQDLPYLKKENGKHYPVASFAANHTLCLPIYSSMNSNDVERVIQCIIKAME